MVWVISTKLGRDVKNIISYRAVRAKTISGKSNTADGLYVEYKKTLYLHKCLSYHSEILHNDT